MLGSVSAGRKQLSSKQVVHVVQRNNGKQDNIPCKDIAITLNYHCALEAEVILFTLFENLRALLFCVGAREGDAIPTA